VVSKWAEKRKRIGEDHLKSSRAAACFQERLRGEEEQKKTKLKKSWGRKPGRR